MWWESTNHRAEPFLRISYDAMTKKEWRGDARTGVRLYFQTVHLQNMKRFHFH